MSNRTCNDFGTRPHNIHMKEAYEQLHTSRDETKDLDPKGKRAFDLASWIQQGSLCRSSCYSQINNDVGHSRTASLSSNTFSTEDNSSLNDSFDDQIDNIEKDLKWDDSHLAQNRGMFVVC